MDSTSARHSSSGIVKDRTTGRLALFLPDMGGGGAERVALTLLQGLLDRGYAVDLVLASRSGALLPLVPAQVEVVDLHAGKLSRTIVPLMNYLRSRRPVAMHAMMWPTPVYAVIARILAGVATRIVASEHTILSTAPFALRYRLARMLTKLAYRRADALTAVSHGAASDLADYVGLPRERITVIHNPLSLPEQPVSDRAARARWPRARYRILAVGELKQEKNFPLLLRAMARLRESLSVSLLILGEGALLGELTQCATAMNLDDIVEFAGFVSDPWPFYAAADLFVLSSNSEGFGNVLVEALHFGLPIVSTDCPHGPREVLADGAFGILTPCNDASAMADAMADMLARPIDADALRARAADLSGAQAVDRHLELMLGRHSVPALR